MYFKILFTIIMAILLSACTPEPEENEFTQMRLAMQKRQNHVFGSSVEKLESRNLNSYLKNKYDVSEIDTAEELRVQQEAEKKRWLAVNIDEEEAEDWKALGLSPKNAARWKKTGLSYNTISVLLKEDVLPSEAVSFMKQDFDKHPQAFIQFSQPLFEFKYSCKTILTTKSDDLSLIRKECYDYIQLLDFSTISGYLADEYQDNDLSLEYISRLRQVDSQKAYIQKEMVKKSYISMINVDKKTFALLFPILETSPRKEEMFFVKHHNLGLENSNRYKSYKYYEFWINKDKAEEDARLAVIAQQEALRRAKSARLKEQANRMEALAYNKMVAAECGEMVTSEPSTGEKVHIEGKILYIIGKKDSNIFAYVVQNSKDSKNYLVRDVNTEKTQKIGSDISWTAVTVGRVASVSLDSDGTASYKHYSSDEKKYYPMLKLISGCAYHTKGI